MLWWPAESALSPIKPPSSVPAPLAQLSCGVNVSARTLECSGAGPNLPPGASGDYRRSALASSFLAALELARQGRVALQQEEAFAPLMLRSAAA